MPCQPLLDQPSPSAAGWLDVGQGHTLWWSRHGADCARGALPVLVLHGGPGSGSSPRHLACFDLARHHVVQFDQRGCGRSQPQGGIEHNTTAHLVADIEALREHLGIAAWLVVGGSWGATLAMAYAMRHPAACLGVLLRGVFLASEADLRWFLNGAQAMRPCAHADFIEGLPQKGVLRAYAEAFGAAPASTGRPFASSDAALRRWLAWEAALDASPNPPGEAVPLPADPQDLARLRARARVQLHYLLHAAFLPEGSLLGAVAGLGHVPCAIVHGTQDLVCRPANAWAVHQAWPGSTLHWVAGEGHSPFQAGMQATMQEALARFEPGRGFGKLSGHTP